MNMNNKNSWWERWGAVKNVYEYEYEYEYEFEFEFEDEFEFEFEWNQEHVHKKGKRKRKENGKEEIKEDNGTRNDGVLSRDSNDVYPSTFFIYLIALTFYISIWSISFIITIIITIIVVIIIIETKWE